MEMFWGILGAVFGLAGLALAGYVVRQGLLFARDGAGWRAAAWQSDKRAEDAQQRVTEAATDRAQAHEDLRGLTQQLVLLAGKLHDEKKAERHDA